MWLQTWTPESSNFSKKLQHRPESLGTPGPALSPSSLPLPAWGICRLLPWHLHPGCQAHLGLGRGPRQEAAALQARPMPAWCHPWWLHLSSSLWGWENGAKKVVWAPQAPALLNECASPTALFTPTRSGMDGPPLPRCQPSQHLLLGVILRRGHSLAALGFLESSHRPLEQGARVLMAGETLPCRQRSL